ncbi:hypothetical protein [Rhodobacteraceae bacterium W635]|uniref:hypothetical protein n=1 Tax=Nioella halotolerans TaxID=2303578 RepID=UPI0011C19F64
MSYSEQQLAQLARLEARLETSRAKAAYRALMDWSESRKRLFLFPISRGAFSAVHLSTRPNARAYADCEFAFKGAKAHLRWWFRKPFFDFGLWGSDVVVAEFSEAETLKSGEIAMNLVDRTDVDRLCRFLETKL